jgi:ribosomal protein S12 methylthiotransferase accessory factor
MSFAADVVPLLGGAGHASLPDWAVELAADLQPVGVVESSPLRGTAVEAPARAARVGVARSTPLTDRVIDRLRELGLTATRQDAGSTLVLLDLSGLDTETSTRLARLVDGTGCPSLVISRFGGETFCGPLVAPHRSACWSCFRLRFADSIEDQLPLPIEADATLARVIADSTYIAARFPAVAAFGCVLVDDGASSSLHEVLPIPWCEACGGPTGSEIQHATVVQSLHVPQELRILAGTRGGIIRRLVITDDPEGIGQPAIPRCSSAVVAGFRGTTTSFPSFTGEGKGATRDAAVRSAIGEGVERYAASLWNPANLTYASLSELGDRAFDPRWLVLYDPEQYEAPGFPFTPFAADRPIQWVTGAWLDTGESVAVPALATYMSFPAPHSEQFGQTTSNGLAAGTSLEDATLRALYELIERDAFMLFWLARLPARRVSEDGVDPLTLEALAGVQRLGAQTELYLIDAGTNHPTVVCLGLGDGHSWPGVTIGLGTHATIDVAAQKAVFEHGHYGSYIRRVMQDGSHGTALSPTDVVSAMDHAMYYADPGRASALDTFRRQSGVQLPLAELRSTYRQPATVAACVEQLQAAGIRAAAVDVTSPDVALSPLRVVRAFGTYMQPIHFGAANRRLQNPRLVARLRQAPEVLPHPIA